LCSQLTFVLGETDAERAVADLDLEKVFLVQEQDDGRVHEPRNRKNWTIFLKFWDARENTYNREIGEQEHKDGFTEHAGAQKYWRHR
jgi:hypothetical protein